MADLNPGFFGALGSGASWGYTNLSVAGAHLYSSDYAPIQDEQREKHGYLVREDGTTEFKVEGRTQVYESKDEADAAFESLFPRAVVTDGQFESLIAAEHARWEQLYQQPAFESAGAAAGFVIGSLGGAAVSPEALAVAFSAGMLAPVVGAGLTAGQAGLRGAKIWGAVGATEGVLLSPFIKYSQEHLGKEYGAGDFVLDVVLSGAIGGVLGGGISAVSALRRTAAQARKDKRGRQADALDTVAEAANAVSATPGKRPAETIDSSGAYRPDADPRIQVQVPLDPIGGVPRLLSSTDGLYALVPGGSGTHRITTRGMREIEHSWSIEEMEASPEIYQRMFEGPQGEVANTIAIRRPGEADPSLYLVSEAMQVVDGSSGQASIRTWRPQNKAQAALRGTADDAEEIGETLAAGAGAKQDWDRGGKYRPGAHSRVIEGDEAPNVEVLHYESTQPLQSRGWGTARAGRISVGWQPRRGKMKVLTANRDVAAPKVVVLRETRGWSAADAVRYSIEADWRNGGQVTPSAIHALSQVTSNVAEARLLARQYGADDVDITKAKALGKVSDESLGHLQREGRTADEWLGHVINGKSTVGFLKDKRGMAALNRDKAVVLTKEVKALAAAAKKRAAEPPAAEDTAVDMGALAEAAAKRRGDDPKEASARARNMDERAEKVLAVNRDEGVKRVDSDTGEVVDLGSQKRGQIKRAGVLKKLRQACEL